MRPQASGLSFRGFLGNGFGFRRKIPPKLLSLKGLFYLNLFSILLILNT